MIVVVVKAKCLIRKHLTVNMSEKIRVCRRWLNLFTDHIELSRKVFTTHLKFIGHALKFVGTRSV